MEVSSPSNPRYGKHLKREELKDLVRPRAESTNAILSWLEQSGVESRDIHNDGEWIHFYAPVKRAEEMMRTAFRTYESTSHTGVKRIRSLEYSVPREIRDHIDIIQPTTRFGNIRAERNQILYKQNIAASTAAISPSCNSTVTPACLAALYNFADYKANPEAEVILGVNGFLEQYARFADFQQFARLYAPYAVGTNFSFTSVNGMW